MSPFRFRAVPGDSTPEVFTGNQDQNTPVRNLFNRDVITQYVRLYPVTPSPQGYALRLDLLGCKPDTPIYVPPNWQGFTPTPFPPDYTGETPTAYPPGYTGPTPTAVPPSYTGDTPDHRECAAADSLLLPFPYFPLCVLPCSVPLQHLEDPGRF